MINDLIIDIMYNMHCVNYALWLYHRSADPSQTLDIWTEPHAFVREYCLVVFAHPLLASIWEWLKLCLSLSWTDLTDHLESLVALIVH